METIELKGWMVPGLSFSGGTRLWLLRWEEIPLFPEPVMEIWLIQPDGTRICYSSRPDMDMFIAEYHTFEEIIPAEITCQNGRDSVQITVQKEGKSILVFSFQKSWSLQTALQNGMLMLIGKDKCASKGKTETGMSFFNRPEKISALRNVRCILFGKDQGVLVAPVKSDRFGDGESSKKPMFLNCTNILEK
jgi:hypothetical protein